MTASTEHLRSLGEWGPAPSGARSAAPAYAVPALVIVLLALLLATVSWAVGAAIMLLGAGGLLLFGRSRGPAALKAAGARPGHKDELPRVRNLLAGLASDLSTPMPELWVIDDTSTATGATGSSAASLNVASLNVMVAWRSGPVVAVSGHLELVLTRTECEALLAHCMVRFASGEAKATTFRAGMGPFAPTGREAAAADLPTVALTRYPPALASALEKVRPAAGTFAALWFAPDAGAEASPDRRAAALREL